MAHIYGLYDSRGNLRYIGKANDPDKRLSSHMRDMRRRDTPLYRWMRENGKPVMRVLEHNCSDWQRSEKELIAHFRKIGCDLLNIADGGNGASGFLESRAIPPQITEAREFFRRGLLALRNLGHSQEWAKSKLCRVQ